MIKHKLVAAVLFFVLAAAVLTMNIAAADVPEPSDIFYVLDMSGVLEADTINYIVEKNDYLYAETGAQIVVVTVNFVRNGDLEQYAYNLFNEWGIGSKDKNNGVLLVLSTGDDDYFCMQGKGLEDSLTSGTIGNMLEEYLEPDFAKQEYDDGVRKIFDALFDRVSALYGYEDTDYKPSDTRIPSSGNNTSGGYNNPNGPPVTSSTGSGISTITIFIIIAVIFFAVRGFGGSSSGCLGCLFGWLMFGGNNRRGGPPGGFGGHGGFGGRGGGRSGGGGGSRSGGGGSSRGGGAGRR